MTVVVDVPLRVGFALVVSVAITNTLLQKLVTDQMRGRVMSMFLLSFMGTMPIGNILAGAASNHFGPQSTLAVGGFSRHRRWSPPWCRFSTSACEKLH